MTSQPSTSKLIGKTPDTPEPDDSKPKEKSIFKCYICNLEENYEFKGQDPQFAKHVTMTEICYMIEDPFLPPRNGEFLTLGSDCCVCNKQICKSSECSFFYCQTYCVNCVKFHLEKFPENVQMKLNKIIKSYLCLSCLKVDVLTIKHPFEQITFSRTTRL